MSTHQHAALEDTVYLFFGANDTSGSGADGATPVYDVRLAGAASGAAPVLSGAATLLSHGDFPAGAHEVAIEATAGNGFVANATYAVFCTLLVDSQNPTGFVGSFTLTPLATASQVASIGSGATGGTHVEATYDNTTRDTIDNAGAVDKGGGLVGIPVTGHAFVAGREVTLAGTVNYNGAFEVISQTTNEVVITDTFVSETFGGSETIVSSIKGEIFVGTITSGTFADTSAPQGDLHSMDDDGDVIKIVYGFNVGGSRQATDIGIFANVNGNTDEMIIKAFNFVTQQFEAKRTLPGSGGTAFIPLDPALVSRNTGTGTELGDVFIFLDTVTTTPSSLDVDLCLLTAVGTNVVIGYPNGYQIAAAGTSGTEFGVNGTAGNPCPFADAVTMNAANPLNMFNIQNGETVALLGNSDSYSLTGEAWTLELEARSIVHMHVRGAAVSGTSTGSGSDFHDCDMGTCTIGPCAVIDSRFTSKTGGGFTMQTAGNYLFHACASRVAGNDSPVFTFPAAGNTFVSDRAGSGGRQYEGMTAGDLASVEGWGQFIEGTCSGGATTIRGCLTNSGISNITITDEARFSVDQVTGGAYPLDTDASGRIRIVDGTGTGELNTNGGRVESDLVYIHGTALTETAGQLATRFTAFFDQAASTFSVNTALSSFKATGFNTVVPDAAGTATSLHSTTDSLITARTLLAAAYFDPAADAVANVTLVATTTTNTDMVGTTGANTVVPDVSGTAAGLHSTTDSLITARTLLAAAYFDPAADAVANVTLVATLTTYTDNTLQTGDSFARIGAPAGASVSADIAAVQADLPSLPTKNVALAGFPFLMVLSSDHVTGATGLSVTAERSIDGAAFASATNSVVELANGAYKIDLSAADMNGTTIMLKFTAATADARFITIVTQPT